MNFNTVRYNLCYNNYIWFLLILFFKVAAHLREYEFRKSYKISCIGSNLNELELLNNPYEQFEVWT